MTEADIAAVGELLKTRRVRPRPEGVQARRLGDARCITGMPTPIRSIEDHGSRTSGVEESAGYDRRVIDYIQHAVGAQACTRSAGWAPSGNCRTSTTCVFLGASLSRYPLEGYREKCSTTTVLGTRHAKKPIELAIPITIAGMSFGALSANVKEALGRAATAWARRPRPATAA